MTAIYQRARPARFDEVVGQDHVTSLLVAALRRGAIGHAYLFSGPRGVGKTTSARLLAMAVNCDAPPDARPCGVCDSCSAVRSGAHPDVVELDAASNNSVDDVRELREQVRLAPLRGGRRVWILDEAHMLSRAAANALLKTLEEPPPGLLFVLATTEPEKLPPTVLSRCQHFRFRRLSDHEIRGKLERLVAEAGREHDGDALALLARAADGAMRDGESMLERLLASGEPITRQAAEDALGLPPRERLEHLGRALADGDLASLLSAAADLYADGFAPRTVAEQLARTLRDALVATVRGDPAGAGAIDADEDGLVRALHALDDAQERFVRRGDLYALEVTLVRAASAMRAPAAAPVAATAGPAASGALPERPPTPPAGAPARSDAEHPAPPPAATEPTAPAAAPTERPAPTAPLSAGAAFDPNARPGARRGAPTTSRSAPSWHGVLSRADAQLKAFLLPAQADVQDDAITVRYDDRHAFHFGQLQKREQAFYELLDGAGAGHLAVVVEGPGGRLQRPAGAPTPGAAGAAVAGAIPPKKA